jgi:hypothetical protein
MCQSNTMLSLDGVCLLEVHLVGEVVVTWVGQFHFEMRETFRFKNGSSASKISALLQCHRCSESRRSFLVYREGMMVFEEGATKGAGHGRDRVGPRDTARPHKTDLDATTEWPQSRPCPKTRLNTNILS